MSCTGGRKEREKDLEKGEDTPLESELLVEHVQVVIARKEMDSGVSRSEGGSDVEVIITELSPKKT